MIGLEGSYHVALPLLAVSVCASIVAIVFGAVIPQQTLDQGESRHPVDNRPTICYHLYNVGKHSEWAECMGVGYVPYNNNDRITK
jgi:hypothetical protein